MLVAIASFVYNFPKSEKIAPQELQGAMDKETQSEKFSNTQDALQASFSSIKHTNTNIPSDCVEPWIELFERSYKELLNNTGHLKAALGSLKCLESVSYSKKKDLIKACKEILNDLNNRELIEDAQKTCLAEILFYRAYVVDQMTLGQKDYKDLDSKILMNKIVALILNNPDKLQDLNPMAEALVAKEPKLYAAHKANLVAKTFSLTSVDPKSKDYNSAEQDYFNTLRELDKFQTNDSEAIEAHFLPYVLRNDFVTLAKVLDQYVQDYGENAVTLYYKSGIAWKQKDATSALAILDKGIRQYPDNQLFKDTRSRLEKKKPGESGAYMLTFKFDFINN